MIRELFILMFIALFVYFIYSGIGNFVDQAGKIISKTTNILSKFDYYISSFSVDNKTKIVITFARPLNFTCIRNVLLDNKTYYYEFKELANNILEIEINESLRGTHELVIDFCNGKLVDSVFIQ